LRVFFWLDGVRHDYFKTRSSVIRRVKRGLQYAGISMPDESREVVFPDGVPVHTLPGPVEAAREGTETSLPPAPLEPEPVSTAAEGDLGSEAERLQDQARRARLPEAGKNLLEDP
jgi:hypothetical protein